MISLFIGRDALFKRHAVRVSCYCNFLFHAGVGEILVISRDGFRVCLIVDFGYFVKTKRTPRPIDFISLVSIIEGIQMAGDFEYLIA